VAPPLLRPATAHTEVPGLVFRLGCVTAAPHPRHQRPEALGILGIYAETYAELQGEPASAPLSLRVDGDAEPLARARELFPQVKEFFLEGDLLSDAGRAARLAREVGRLGIPWSCRSRPNVPPETLRLLRANGLRLLVAAYDSGSQRILSRSGAPVRLEAARDFTRTCRELGIRVHGTFQLGCFLILRRPPSSSHSPCLAPSTSPCRARRLCRCRNPCASPANWA
jgi:hypothetical protein